MPLRADGLFMPHASLRRCNAFGVEAHAERYVRARTPGELAAALEALRDRPQTLTILGEGSNVLMRPWLPGCVVQPALRGIEIAEQGGADGEALVTAAAGEHWHDLVRFCIAQGLGGVENLALIPGSVGAAPFQNIGAYGVELSQSLESLTALCRASGETVRFTNAECRFAYRDSIFKSEARDRYVITSITLRLGRERHPVTGYAGLEGELERMAHKAGPPTTVEVAEAVIRLRRRKLPDHRTTGNAGSFFKNPVVDPERFEWLRTQLPDLSGFPERRGLKISAARLIEACGWKGHRRGGAAVWHRQPLVLVNAGSATAEQILDLAEAVRGSVLERFGVALEREVQLLGEWRPSPA